MSLTAPRTILLNCQLAVHDEAPCSGNITPGDLVKFAGNGVIGNHTLVRNSTVGSPGPVRVAKECGLNGGTIDDDYVIGNQAFCVTAQSGEKLLVNMAASQGVMEAQTPLQSNGDGKFGNWSNANGNVALVRLDKRYADVASVQKVEVTVI